MLANTSIEVVLGMSFFPLSIVDIGLPRACLLELHNAEAMPIGHQVFAPEFPAAAVAQEGIQLYFHLERLVPMQSLLILLLSSEISLILLQLILRQSVLNQQLAGLFAFQA